MRKYLGAAFIVVWSSIPAAAFATEVELGGVTESLCVAEGGHVITGVAGALCQGGVHHGKPIDAHDSAR